MPKLVKLKVQLYCGSEIAMGPGKADLLDAIRAHGSISAAARAIDMSYRRAWSLVDCMNRCWREPLVQTSPGISHGGGARITPFGNCVLAQFRELQGRLDSAACSADLGTFSQAMLPAPKVSQKNTNHPPGPTAQSGQKA